MLYVRIDETGTPQGLLITEKELRKELSNYILPKDIKNSDIIPLGFEGVEAGIPPTKLLNHSLRPVTPVRGQNGKLMRVYTSVPYTEIESRVRWAEMRAKRDELLKTTVDSMNPIRWESMSEEDKTKWRTYRQALLDLPANTTDPAITEFPVKP